LTLLQLRYLLAIADNGLNITAAANQLYTSQPGVCKQLRLLEEELGLQLFTRHGRRLIGITTAGDQIIIHARLIMREVEAIRSLTRGLIKEERGSRDRLVNDSPHVATVNRRQIR
jgi:DNA-binding transcriptional LysR family regulator